jgi:WhiB family redox-sensing transcriptional regulator
MTAIDVAPTWVQLAACRGMDTGWWFPERGDTFSGQVALTICRTCPVRAECLAEAMALGDVEGIRGGLTAGERRALSDS